MQVRVCMEGEVAIMTFSPFLFCSTTLSSRIINIKIINIIYVEAINLHKFSTNNIRYSL
jgi:hypothetical protein